MDDDNLEQTTEQGDAEAQPEIAETEFVHIPVVRQLMVTLGILVLVFGVTYMSTVVNILGGSEDTQGIMEAQVLPPVENVPTDIDADPFGTLTLRARAVYVWDVQNQRVIFKKNADEQLPLASVTKLMTALVAYELLGENASVRISLDAIKQDGESGFLDGELFNSQDLTDLTLITSSNDGAYALAATAGGSVSKTDTGASTFVHAMNIRAKDIGLTQTYFSNPTGLDISPSVGGAYGSARDMAFLMEYIITRYPEVIELTKEDYTKIANENGETHEAENTNTTVSEIPGLIASKTGYTELAGGNLIIAFQAGLNRPIIIAVLGSTQNGRFSDIRALASAAQKFVTPDN